jgi:hypothetical protein
MGRTGSGKRYHKKRLIEDCWSLSIRDILPVIRAGAGCTGALRVRNRYGIEDLVNLQIVRDEVRIVGIRLVYSASHGRQAVDYCNRLQTTVMPGGDQRWWFTCEVCGRRAGKLYLPLDALYFTCWRCHRLTWESNQTEHAFDKVFRQTAAEHGIQASELKRVFEEGTVRELHKLLGQ